MGVIDLTSGLRLALLSDVNLVGIIWNPDYLKGAARGIQIDPPTRSECCKCVLVML